MYPEQQNNTALSSEDLLKHMQSLEKRIKSLEVTNRVILGLFIGTLAAAMTVGAGFAIAAAPVIAGSIVGGILATVALAALGVTAYKYRAEIKAGFKYAAEKTVEGAKHTAGKIKAGAVYAKDSVKEAASSLKQATREGASSALKKMGEDVQNLGRKMSDRGASISDLESIPYSTEPQEPQGVVLLAKRELDPDLIDSNRDLERDSLQSNGLPRSSSMDSLNSVRTNSTVDSTVGLLTGEHKEVKAPTSFWDRFSSPFKSGKKSEQTSNIQYQPPFESDAMPSAKIGNSIFYVDLSEPPKAPESPTSGYGSRRSSPNSSGSSTPKFGQNPSLKEEFDAELAKRLEKLSKSSSGSPTPPKPPVPPKPLAVNLAEANERKKQQTPSTSRSNSPDSGRDSSGSSTPTGRQSPPVKELLKLFDPLYGPNSSNNDISVTGVHDRRETAV